MCSESVSICENDKLFVKKTRTRGRECGTIYFVLQDRHCLEISPSPSPKMVLLVFIVCFANSTKVGGQMRGGSGE